MKQASDSDSKTRNRGELIKGELLAEFIEYDFGIADTGADQIAMAFRLVEAPWTGKIVTWYGTFSEAAFPLTVDAMRAVGWQGRFLTTLKSDLRRGKLVQLVCEVEDYNGEDRSRVKFVNSAGVRLKTRMTGEQRRDFGKDFQSRLDAGAGERNRTRGNPPVDPGAPEDGDDIPF
ncbi:MAG: hypothetical protein ACRENK_16415 [Gemmatimonadaceae bacterium]